MYKQVAQDPVLFSICFSLDNEDFVQYIKNAHKKNGLKMIEIK